MSTKSSFWLLVALNFLDAILTIILISFFGAEEANPIIGWFLGKMGFAGIFVCKGILLTFFGYLMYYHKVREIIIKVSLQAGIISYVCVIIYSLALLCLYLLEL